MKATKDYGPCTSCDKPIKKGDDFVIVGGEFHHAACANATGGEVADLPETTATEAPKPKPRKRSPSPDAKPATPAKPKAAAKPKAKSKAKAKAKAKAEPKAPAKAKPKAAAKPIKAAAEPKAAPKADPKPKRKAVVTKTTESPNGITVRLLCGQASTDEEIVKAVLKKFPDREEKRIRADISVNRSELNRGNYKSAREKYGLEQDVKIEKLVKVGKDRVPASQAPDAAAQ